VVNWKDSVRIYHRKRSFRWLMNSRPVRLNHRKSEFPAKMPLVKINFLSHGISVSHVPIVDRHLQIVRFPMVQSDLDLELGKLVKISLQD
jgi:hypothetical protein